MTYTHSKTNKQASDGYRLAIALSFLLHILLIIIILFKFSSQKNDNIKPLPPIYVKLSSTHQNLKPKKNQHTPNKIQEKKLQREKILQQQKQQEKKLQREKILQQQKQQEKQLQREKILQQQKQQEEKLQREKILQQQEQQEKELQREKILQQQEQQEKELQREKILQQQEQQEQILQQQKLKKQKELTTVNKYSQILNHTIVNNWTRPPNSNNNMVALFQVTLSSFGDLIEIKLLSSSGNSAFDQSASLAIRKAAPFIEIKQLNRTIFNQYFHRFKLKFKPEDLVR